MMLAFMERCEGSTDERAGQAITYLKFLRLYLSSSGKALLAAAPCSRSCWFAAVVRG